MPSSATDSRPIALLDSGVGGIPYLANLRKKLPRENFLYLADSAHFPYGNRSREEISRMVRGAAELILKNHDPKILILACNSASVSALDDLRRELPLPVVGVVPAIKPAATLSRTKCLGILATERTVNAPYVDTLINRFARDCRVVRAAAGDIVEFVENRLIGSSREEQDRLIRPAADLFLREGADAVVLGCTHFTYLDENIRALSGGVLMPVDSREGVAAQTVRLLEREGSLKDSGPGSSLFYSTSLREDDYYQRLAMSFFLDYRGLMGKGETL